MFENISVIIPAYNASATICRAIKSILDQTHQATEIIVVDDGSTDMTSKLVATEYPQVHLFQQSNQGASVARNFGASKATSKWISFLDADDFWLPYKLELQIKILKKNVDLMWCFTNFLLSINTASGIRIAENLAPRKSVSPSGFFMDYYSAMLENGWTFHISSLVIKRDIFLDVRLRTDLKVFEDVDFMLKVARRFPKTGFVDEPCLVYSIGNLQSLSHQYRDLQKTFTILEEHLAEARHRVSKSYEQVLKRMACELFMDSVGSDRIEEAKGLIAKAALFIPHTMFFVFKNLLHLSDKGTRKFFLRVIMRYWGVRNCLSLPRPGHPAQEMDNLTKIAQLVSQGGFSLTDDQKHRQRPKHA